MRRYKSILIIAVALVAFLGFESCSPASGDNPGHEYMPDMGHSVAYEANVINEYYQNTWDVDSENQSGFTVEELSRRNQPVQGTMPRGYAGIVNMDNKTRLAKMKELRGETSINGIAVPVNGKVPYYIPNTDAGRAYAYEATELTNNPFPITKEGLARGKELYNIYCGICHGEKGDGNGWLARDDSPYNAGPTNYLTDDLIDAKNGRYYHVIMHGKGVMGAYKDKISHEERWQVIHWIRALQAKEKKMVYNEYENTLNNWATPYADTDGSIDLDNSALAKDFKKLIGATATTVSHDDHSHGHETHDGHGHADDYGHEGGSHAEPSASLQLNNVFFDTGKASLKAESKTELNTLAALLKTYATVSIQVAGHTDSEGADDFNMTLSDERAASVTAYLEAKGIESSRITSVGYGETKPVSQNVTEEGRAKNRRTEFSITSK